MILACCNRRPELFSMSISPPSGAYTRQVLLKLVFVSATMEVMITMRAVSAITRITFRLPCHFQ